jgi:hypothetical protein
MANLTFIKRLQTDNETAAARPIIIELIRSTAHGAASLNQFESLRRASSFPIFDVVKELETRTCVST